MLVVTEAVLVIEAAIGIALPRERHFDLDWTWLCIRSGIAVSCWIGVDKLVD